jgi:glucose/mannose-6-phosphate isomerase
MNLDNWKEFNALDSQDMLGEIDNLPDQLMNAWQLGQDFTLPTASDIQHVVLAGMGGSAIGADLLHAHLIPQIGVPITVWRNYDLPAFVNKHSLVVVSSHSGNTEESLSAFDRALELGAQILAISTGGELSKRAAAAGITVWQFEHEGQPRAAVGYSFGLLLAAMSRLGLIDDPSKDVEDTVARMREQQASLRADIAVAQNPAKRVAGQFVGRWPTVVGADFLFPVARRWRTQISEIAKAVAQFEELPEADHNLVAGVSNPEEIISKTIMFFLHASNYHSRNLLRTDVTKEILMVEGFNTDVYYAVGASRLSQQWTTLHFGDYVSFYLAMSYGVDPSPVPAIENLKVRLKG